MNSDIYENYVIGVFREGSLTKAAEKLGISQPALSSGLTSLEKKLGFRIFNRSVTPVTLTPEGEIYLSYIRRKKALAADFETQIEACKGQRDNHVSIGAPVVYAESLVARAVCALLRKNPACSVSVRTASLNRLIEMTADGELDCFISTSGDLPAAFIKEEIKQEQIFLCVPGNDRINGLLKKEGRGFVRGADFALLADTEFILLEEDQPIRRLTDSFLKENGITLRSRVTVNQVSTAVDLACRGLGCCFASEDALGRLDAEEKLCVYTLPELALSRRIYAVYHGDFFHPRACADLIGCLVHGDEHL